MGAGSQVHDQQLAVAMVALLLITPYGACRSRSCVFALYRRGSMNLAQLAGDAVLHVAGASQAVQRKVYVLGTTGTPQQAVSLGQREG